jgi:hypothetical protein
LLRDQLIAEIKDLKGDNDLALWAHRRLPAKNTLITDDATAVEAAYLAALGSSSLDVADELVTPLRKTVRKRNKAHLAFVAGQPCLVCQRTPCDAHHLKFVQPRTLGRKVSDEFTVPLCRDHHQELHRNGNEIAWWANVQIAPIEAAKDLWDTTTGQGGFDVRPKPSVQSNARPK